MLRDWGCDYIQGRLIGLASSRRPWQQPPAETVLPAAGNATPSIYEIGGREYVVIVCGGGKNGAPSGSSIVAFGL